MKNDNEDAPIVQPEVTPQPEHSMLKLALATILTPKDAFDEITRRKLLGPGLIIAALVGFLYAGATIFAYYAGGGGSLFGLGVSNPLTTLGTVLLTAMLLQWLAVKFSKSEAKFIDTLIVLLWANAIVVVAFLIGLIPALTPVAIMAPVLGVIIAIMGVKHVHKMTGISAAATYLLAALATAGVLPLVPNIVALKLGQIYLQTTYGQKAIDIGSQAAFLAVQLASAWMAALALVAGSIVWPKIAPEVSASFRKLLGALGVLAIIGAAVFTFFMLKFDPIKPVMDGVRNYQGEEVPSNPAQAARDFSDALKYYPNDYDVQLYYADALAASGNYKEAGKYYDKISKLFPGVVDTGNASIRYFQGDYKAAADALDGVVKKEPRYGEAQARLALADLRLGKDKEAESAANAAIAAEYKGYLPHLVLAQLYTKLDDKKKAETAIADTAAIEPDLAKRIEKTPGKWSTAAESLTPTDLRMPLEMPKIVPEAPKGKKK